MPDVRGLRSCQRTLAAPGAHVHECHACAHTHHQAIASASPLKIPGPTKASTAPSTMHGSSQAQNTTLSAILISESHQE